MFIPVLDSIPLSKVLHDTLVEAVKHLQVFSLSIQNIGLSALWEHKDTAGQSSRLWYMTGIYLEKVLIEGV